MILEMEGTEEGEKESMSATDRVASDELLRVC